MDNQIDTSMILAPMGTASILDQVQALTYKRYGETDCFRHYDAVLREIWPDLFKRSEVAGIKLSIALFFDVAERNESEITERNFQRPGAPPIRYNRHNRRVKVGV